MKTTVSENDFIQAFRTMNRQDNFSVEGLVALFGELSDMEESDMREDPSNEIELDVIALCCEFAEYENLEAFQADYGAEDYPDTDSIQQKTWYIDIDDVSFIIQQF